MEQQVIKKVCHWETHIDYQLNNYYSLFPRQYSVPEREAVEAFES